MVSPDSRVSVPAQFEALGKQDSFAVLKALAEASAVFIALTFVGGWSYLSSYFKTFGINPLDLDFSIPVVSTLAVYVMYQTVWPLLVTGALIATLAVIARRGHRLTRSWIVAAFGIVLFAVASAGLFRGRQVADWDMLDDPNSTALPYVAFATKVDFKGGAKPSCVEVGTLGSLDCKLLMHPKTTYYFFKPVSRVGADNLNLYMLCDSDLIAAQVQRGLGRNEVIK